MPEPVRVAAVVATYNRSAVLARTLHTVNTQERRADTIYVVDNGSSDDTVKMLSAEHPEVVCIELHDNVGAGGGLAAGMRAAFDVGHDLCWLLDDDTQPHVTTLDRLLQALEISARFDPGIVAASGGVIRRGVVHHVPTPELPALDGSDPSLRGLHRADFVVYDGGLVTRAAAERVGFPRDDFFLVFDDLEYAMRVREAGLTLIVTDQVQVERGHLGSGAGAGTSPPWRGYYQTRNQLRVALDRRSLPLLYGWAVRNAKFLAALLVRGDRRWQRFTLRLRGTYDACTNRLGRRVEPS
jgi:GT2 family glycosyltransferase